MIPAMAWTKPKFTSKSQVDKAGEALLSELETSDDNLEILNNWRSIHACPLLTMRMLLSSRAKQQFPQSVISQRIKRIAAIRLKLSENRKFGLTMNLSQMQDIGGCRATLPNVAAVDELVRLYESAWKKNSSRGGILKKKQDYIDSPKSTGYRGVHLICKYQTSSKDLSIYNGLQIELQLRSRLQHYWATAVETIDFYTGQTLKSNIGQLPWKRFFVLVANEFARMEGRTLIPGAPDKKSESIEELKKDHQNQLTAILGIQTAHKVVSDDKAQSGQLYLLQLDLAAHTLQRTAFNKDQIAEAQEKYLQLELQYKDNPSIQTVLVSVDSMAALPKAYPNFYLDIGAFSKHLTQMLR